MNFIRPFYTNIVYLAIVLTVGGLVMLATAKAGYHVEAKAAFLYCLGMAALFASLCLSFSQKEFDEDEGHKRFRPWSPQAGTLIPLGLLLLIAPALMLDSAVYTDSVYEGAVVGFVGIVGNVMRAFASR